MGFKEIKKFLLKDIETEKIDEKMRPWLDKFNFLPRVATTFCCQGHRGDEISEEEKKEIEKMHVEGCKVFLDGFPPYISFIVDSDRLEEDLFLIEGIKFEAQYNFHVDINKHWANGFIQYGFHFPFHEFDKLIEKVYNKCVYWDSKKDIRDNVIEMFL